MKNNLKGMVTMETRYLQVYQCFKAPECIGGDFCDLVIFNESVRDRFYVDRGMMHKCDRRTELSDTFTEILTDIRDVVNRGTRPRRSDQMNLLWTTCEGENIKRRVFKTADYFCFHDGKVRENVSGVISDSDGTRGIRLCMWSLELFLDISFPNILLKRFGTSTHFLLMPTHTNPSKTAHTDGVVTLPTPEVKPSRSSWL